jgi:hypothetical protein
MRWMIALIMILLAVFYFMKEPERRPVEETFIGEQIKPLRKAEGFEEEFLKMDQEHQKQIQEELEKAGG